ncbi:uncharacterized protein LOC122961758 [Acropora millepora]|uniref:uncharacterized protein LOC122961758 n=1 Tax=Acropora millepora TaxID=45264 RepID=UPI001CF57109|nr:uncharacterized protein LOC122961758 [Acropora millepora]
MSYVGLLWITFTFLLLGCYGKPTDRICWFVKRTRTEEECQGPLRFDEAIARFANGDLNCWACTRHWMRASREANEYCSSPFLEHSTQLSKRRTPKRFYHLFDRLGPNTQNYRPGIRWCNKCATIADNALSKESDYIPPKKQTKSTTSTSTTPQSSNNNKDTSSKNSNQLETVLENKESTHLSSDITFDQLVTQCQTALFRYYDSKPEAPLYDPVIMREFCEENAPGLFDLLLRSITRNDGRISPDREALQRKRTVSLIHILSYFRFVVGNLCYLGN